MARSDHSELWRNANIRLCRLCFWPNYDGFGVNFQSSAHPPHFVSLVLSNSPAAAGGLKILDVILAVNQLDVSNSDYSQVRDALISARDSNVRVELLVVEQRFYQVLKEKGIRIDSSLATVIDTPTTMPFEYQNFPKLEPRTCLLTLNLSESSFGFEIVNGEDDIGAYVQEVLPNTSASRTQLRKSDRIIKINDKFVDSNVSKSILEKLDETLNKRAVKLYVMDTETYTYYNSNKIPSAPKSQQINQTNHRLFGSFRKSSPVEGTSHLPSLLLMLLEEDIRLCTINSTSANDMLPLKLNYYAKGNFYSLTIESGQDNEPSSK